jgi:site-specific DNA-adenine methylase
MFSYYGSKSKIINYYPSPKYNRIIEPFAGSARYSLKYYENQCWINDLYSIIFDIWRWIQNATMSDLEKIPNLKKGDDLRNFDLESDLKKLLGFAVNYGSAFPVNLYTNWASKSHEIETLKKKLLKYIGKIKHWKITNYNYLDIPNEEATWFIDPPYQHGGYLYVENKIDYTELANWCLSRKGQIVVCENSKADWLPFTTLKRIQGQASTMTTEVIFTQ